MYFSCWVFRPLHSTMFLYFEFCPQKKKKPKSAYWHFNLTLLDNKDFICTFKLFWADKRTKTAYFQSVQKWWDFGKIQIIQDCQQYAQNSTNILNESMKDLETDINKIQELAEFKTTVFF